MFLFTLDEHFNYNTNKIITAKKLVKEEFITFEQCLVIQNLKFESAKMLCTVFKAGKFGVYCMEKITLCCGSCDDKIYKTTYSNSNTS